MDDRGDPAAVDPPARSVRRSPEQADRLRARMLREGYPLGDLTHKENERLWLSLTQRRRWDKLQALTGWDDGALRQRVRALSRQRQTLRGG